jgi:hypothetical protein
MPGYWGATHLGFQWTAGYWADARMNEIEYLPEPPEAAEVGPSSERPSPDQSWIPGSWVWHDGRYAWRPGYWVVEHADWDWIPSHYTWAPRGYVYVDGYWDYSVNQRGILFAPVYFDSEIYGRRGYSYSPSVVISLDVFSDHLFLRPRYSHYYFGDYYAASYQDAGFYSRRSFQSSHRGYDPIYTHQRWAHRDDPSWEIRIDADFRHRREHIEARPPRTLRAQLTLDIGARTSDRRGVVIAASLNELAKRADSSFRLRAVDNEERQGFAQRGREVRHFRDERQKLESQAPERSTVERGHAFAPARVAIPSSPIVAKRRNELANDRTPPTRQKAPELDPKVEARPRKARARTESSRREPQKKQQPSTKQRKVKKDKPKRKDKDKP